MAFRVHSEHNLANLSHTYSHTLSKFLVLFVAQATSQIQCFILRNASSTDTQQNQAVVKALQSALNHANHLNKKALTADIRDILNPLLQVQGQLSGDGAQVFKTVVTDPFQALLTKFQSGNGNFNDIFAMSAAVRDFYKKAFGDLCPAAETVSAGNWI